MVGGLVSTVLLIVCSPVFSGGEKSIFPDANFAWFPLSNPGIVSIPLGFLLGWLGSVTSKKAEDASKAAEMYVRAYTGHGAEKASEH